MAFITVANISAAVAAVFVVIHLLLPNIIVLAVAGFVKREHTAITWSAIGKAIHGSLWPILLRADSSSDNSLPIAIRLLLWSRPIAVVLLSVAAIVTPLGLYDITAISNTRESVAFEYVADPGPMLYGRSSPVTDPFSRWCRFYLCPGTPKAVQYENMTGWLHNVTYTIDDYIIPRSLVDLYQSGLDNLNNSVSSIFDIQSRKYKLIHAPDVSINPTPMLHVSDYRHVASFELNNKVELIEGLIVDTREGRIGFRNHSAPVGSAVYSEWEEDILFLQPQTFCTDLNITRLMTVDEDAAAISEHHIVDRGGFANFDRHAFENVPKIYNKSLLDGQADPGLQLRSFYTALRFNYLLMLRFNVTNSPTASPASNVSAAAYHYEQPFQYINSSIGSMFGALENFSTTLTEAQSLKTDKSFGGAKHNNLSNIWNDTANPFHPILYPFVDETELNGGYNLFSDLDDICSFSWSRFSGLMSAKRIATFCGLVQGMPHRADGGDPSILSSSSKWEQAMYVCSSAVKATIETVSFKHDPSYGNQLASLSVSSIQSKSYASDDFEPLWGTEKYESLTSGYWLPLWGLVSPSAAANSKHVDTVRSNRFYLPSSGSSLSLNSLSTSLPGVEIMQAALDEIYSIDSTQSSDTSVTEYSALTNMALGNKWRELSQNATSVSKIPNLIWTDLVANAVMGTRGWNTLRFDKVANASEQFQTTIPRSVPVSMLQHKVKYHWVYAIPGFVCLAWLVILGVLLVAQVLLGMLTYSRLKLTTNVTSVGRLMTTLLYPRQDDSLSTSTKKWMKADGTKTIILGDDAVLRPGDASIYSNNSAGPLMSSSNVSKEDHEVQVESSCICKSVIPEI